MVQPNKYICIYTHIYIFIFESGRLGKEMDRGKETDGGPRTELRGNTPCLTLSWKGECMKEPSQDVWKEPEEQYCQGNKGNAEYQEVVKRYSCHISQEDPER